MDMDNVELLLFVKTIEIIYYIATADYPKLEEGGYLKEVTKNDIVSAIEDYGGVVSLVDERYIGRFRFVRCKKKNTFITFADLIIDNKISDLTLICEMTISDNLNTIESAIIEDLHVL